jgi:hypothetical protein
MGEQLTLRILGGLVSGVVLGLFLLQAISLPH